MSTDYKQIITIEPGKRNGKPCVRGMRITVYDVLEYLASGMTTEQIIEDGDIDAQAALGQFVFAKLQGPPWTDMQIDNVTAIDLAP